MRNAGEAAMKVFVSHSRSDEGFARELVSRLAAAGFKVGQADEKKGR